MVEVSASSGQAGQPIQITLTSPPPRPPTAADQFRSGLIFLLGGLAGGAIGIYIDWDNNRLSHAQYQLAVAQYQLALSADVRAVVDYTAKGDTPVALGMIEDNQNAAKLIGAAESQALVALRKMIDRGDTPVEPGTDLPTELDAEQLRKAFFSSERRQFSADLVSQFNKLDQAGRDKMIGQLLAAIIPKVEDDKRRYRVNLYIALTFSKLPEGALNSVDQRAALVALKGYEEYSADSTFKLNVDRAVAQQGA